MTPAFLPLARSTRNRFLDLLWRWFLATARLRHELHHSRVQTLLIHIAKSVAEQGHCFSLSDGRRQRRIDETVQRYALFVDLFVLASTLSRLGDAQVTTNLAGKMVRDFIVPWHSGAASVFRVSPPGMVSSLTYKFAPIVDEVSNQIAAFHGNMAISSKDSPAADFASSRFNSIASDNASRRFAISSSRVSP